MKAPFAKLLAKGAFVYERRFLKAEGPMVSMVRISGRQPFR